jgi:histidinol dehydrogenase
MSITNLDKVMDHKKKFLARFQDVELLKQTLDEINTIKSEGEAAILKKYKSKNIARDRIFIERAEVAAGVKLIDDKYLKALEELANRVRKIAKKELEPLKTEIVLDDNKNFHSSIISMPLETIGIYVPDNMPSTLILYCVLAEVAGVRNIILALPPKEDGSINPALLAAASLFRVSALAVGGKSAFPALAFGLAGYVPSKLFGPCSFYVDYVKQILNTFYKIPVDIPAGPSELVIFADDSKDIEQVELDIRAQMEHGGDSICFMISTNQDILDSLSGALQDISSQVEYIKARDDAEVSTIINTIAPEILEIFSTQPNAIVDNLVAVANVYINMCSPLGDYCAAGKGCSDPTYGMAAGLSGITIGAFFKECCITTGLERNLNAPWLELLPELEKFSYHKQAIEKYREK